MIHELPCRLVQIRPRPETLYTSQNRTVMTAGHNGMIEDPDHGLFVHETRLLSRYRYLIDGAPPEPVALSNVEQHSWLGYYVSLPPDAGMVAEDRGSGRIRQVSQTTLELRVSRYIGDGMHEDLDLTNFSQEPTRIRFEIEVAADFADLDVASGGLRSVSDVGGVWKESDDESRELSFEYHTEHVYDHQGTRGVAKTSRALTIRILNSDSPATHADGRIGFEIVLLAAQRWHCCIDFLPFIDGRVMLPLYGCRSFGQCDNVMDQRRRAFLSESTVIDAGDRGDLRSTVVASLEQAKHDLAALRLYDLDLSDREWTTAAGLPEYIALFGRDTLTTAWQASLASTSMARGTLPQLVRWQGTRDDDWRDEQPGKMLHEAHTGPSSTLGLDPRDRYYGSITTSAFFPVALSELWHWTGDLTLVRPLVAPALEALRWLTEHAEGSHHFYEYLTRSVQGVKNQAWKDSGDAIVDVRGCQVDPPIATCEEQGFVYAAKFQLAELLWWLGEKESARRIFREAKELKKRFNEAYWMEDERFYALGLDSAGRQIRSITSNPGHCLATGIVDTDRAAQVADRLFEDDLFSGWGIRTLSSRHPAYNPYSYHRGTIWPVEQGSFALGLMRYGLLDHLHRLCKAQFEATALFDHCRPPECFSGHSRAADHPFPALYPKANAPQAWSSSALFCLLQAMLGLYPYAPLNMLLVDPHLPPWLPELTLRGLHVGTAVITISFFRRQDGESDYRVTDKRGPLHVLRQPSPWSLVATAGERIKDVLLSLLPGR